MRRAVGLLVVAALASGCGSTVQVTSRQPGAVAELGTGDTGAAAAGGAAAGPAQQGAAAGTPGVPAVRGSSPVTGAAPVGATTVPGQVASQAAGKGPLKVGVLYSSNGAANSALGVSTSTASDPKAVMTALLKGLNQAGGFAGRTLVPVFDSVDATTSDYSGQATAACSFFTQDHPVQVVIDIAYGNKFGMASCLAAKGVLDIGIMTSDSVADDQVGLFAAPGALSSTQRYPLVLQGLHASGYLTAGNKVGVLLEDCPDLQRAFDQAVKPAISGLGLTLADTEHLSCTTGFSSAGPAAASVQSAALRFRSSGVDRILFVSDFEQVTLLLLSNYAQSQDWHPGYLLSSQAQPEVMRPNIPQGQWPQLHGVGWSPYLDVDDTHQPLPSLDRRCLDLVKAGGVTVKAWQDTYVATTECNQAMFLGAALVRSRGVATGRALMAAVEQLGTGYQAPGLVSGRTSFGPHRHEGPAAVREFAFQASCSCLAYVGAASAAA